MESPSSSCWREVSTNNNTPNSLYKRTPSTAGNTWKDINTPTHVPFNNENDYEINNNIHDNNKTNSLMEFFKVHCIYNLFEL